MTVSATLISAVAFNNLNFTRYLTASLLAYTYVPSVSSNVYGIIQNNPQVSWTFPTIVTAYSAASLTPNNIYPTTVVGTTATGYYLTGAYAPVASVSTLYFAFTATTYDDTTTNYTLCSFPIYCTFANNTDYTNPPEYIQKFDTFPDIKLTAFINYENTNNASYFYRLTSTSPFSAAAAFKSSSFKNLTAAAPYVPSLSTNLYGATYTINNKVTAVNNLNAIQAFTRTSPAISSVGITLTAVSGNNSFAPWYTPHAFSQTISAKFVPYFLSADFIGFPDTVFNADQVQAVNSSNYQSLTAGLSFLGEGHTANVTLSSAKEARATAYNWTISNFTHPTSSLTFNSFPLSSVSNTGTLTTSMSSVTAVIPTLSGQSILPISLQVGDNNYFCLSANPPKIQYNDSTGALSFYPYYSSTLDTLNNEATATNNIYHQSIIVRGYDVSPIAFYPNVNTGSVIPSDKIIYLPPNGTPYYYLSQLTSVSSVNNTPCLDTAGGNKTTSLIWSWAALSSTPLNNLNNTTYPLSTQSVIPSSWSMAQCLSSVAWDETSTTLSAVSALYTIVTATPGPFAKKWGFQGVASSSITSPVSLSGGGITWALFTNDWQYPGVLFTNYATNTFSWTLQLSGDGTTTTNTGGTLPLYRNTSVTVQAQQTVLASIPDVNCVSPVINDWVPRFITITPSTTLTSIGLPNPLLYTPNRYVLTGADIPLQNVTTNAHLVTATEVVFDNTLSYYITGNPYYNTFIASSTSIGYKNVTITSYTNYPNYNVVTTTLPNIVNVVSQYDDVRPVEYRTVNSAINLPWPTTPKVGANDWVIADNINSCITKLYDNLQYLDTLGKTYNSRYSDYFGYICPINYNTVNTVTTVDNITGTVVYCPSWTWRDLNTAITPSNNITWLTLSGVNVACGTWLDQTCSFTNASPAVSAITSNVQNITTSTSLVVPTGVTSINIVAEGAGGGAGGNDKYFGYSGYGGNIVQASIDVTPGDTLTLYVGKAGSPGTSRKGKRASGGTGGIDPGNVFSGGTGGKAGPLGNSGSGGGGGAATSVYLNGVPVLVAGGGGGGGGGGYRSAGQPQQAYTSSGSFTGGAGVSKLADGGGGGGGGGGYQGGAGGNIIGGQTGGAAGAEDQGAYSGSNGANLIPAGGISSTASNVGGDGIITINYNQTTVITSDIPVNTDTIVPAISATITTINNLTSVAANTIPLTSAQGILYCNPGTWNVNIPGLDTNYNKVNNGNYVNSECVYTSVVSINNNIYLAKSTQLTLLSSDYSATVYGVYNTIDGKKPFASIVSISIDSAGKIFVLDKNLSQIIVLTVDANNNWYEYNNWGGFGFASAKSKFNLPQDIHIDQLDNVWVCDTGNKAIKQYSNTGTWLLTINDTNLINNPPLSLAVDSQQNVHVLTSTGILVYSYTGSYLYTYTYNDRVTSVTPRRINTSHNREIIYVAFNTQVLKYFRTGAFAGYIIQAQDNVTNINDIYQDEYRNLLIVSDNIVLKYPDLMQLIPRQGNLPVQYWPLNDLLIHKEEYVQNWVYNKSFQRLWDNIELFRNTLQYSSGNCLSYTAPIHDKSKMIIGQNEIVTSTVINRVLGYLWDNFYTLVKFFDPNCDN